MTAAVIPSVLPQLDLPGPLGDFCDQVGLTSVPCALAEVPDAATTAMEVVTDPFGSFVGALHGAARGLTTDVVPALVDMARPNLEQAWWVDAYRLAFGLAILVFAILVLWNLTQTSRGKMSGDQFVNSITFYAVMFFFGATFGPALGALLVTGFGRLTDNVVSADSVGLDSGINTITAKLESTVDAAGLGMVINGDLQKITGGSFVAAMMLFLMCIALILVFVVLIVQLVTLYLSGVLIPLSLVWIINPSTRSKGFKLVALWIGMLSAQVLVFFLLGVGFNLVGNLTSTFDKPALQILMDMAVAVIALFMATLAPFGLLAFGKAVLPTSSPSPTHKGSMPSIGDHSASDGGGGSQLSSLSKQQAADASSDAGGSGGGAAGGAAPQPAMAGLTSGGAGSAASAGGADGGAGGGSGGGGGSGAGGSGGAGAGGGSLGGGASGGGMAGAGAGGSGGALAGAGAGAGGGAAGGGTMATAAAAGGATAATGGAAAALAAPLILGKMAYDKGSDLAGKAADTAVEHMDYGMEDMTRRDGD